MRLYQTTSHYPQVFRANKLLLLLVPGLSIIIERLPDWPTDFDWKSAIPIVFLFYLAIGGLSNLGLGLFALFKGQKRVFIAYEILSAVLFGILLSIFAIVGPMPD